MARRRSKKDTRLYIVNVHASFVEITNKTMKGFEMNRLLRQMAKVQRGIYLKGLGKYEGKKYLTAERMKVAGLQLTYSIKPFQYDLFEAPEPRTDFL